MKRTKEIYLSVDIEADGPIPGLSSMLSFGVAAFKLDAPDPYKPLMTFSANLEALEVSHKDDFPICGPDPDTMAWWAKQPEAWEACRKDPRDPAEVMPEFVRWVRGFKAKPVVIGYPITYDFMWLYWYTMALGGLHSGERCPFGFSGMDLKTMAALKLDCDFLRATKRNMPRAWFKGAPKHDHVALTDAIGQGVMFVNMVLDGKEAP
jgi:hypothetical protein